MQMHIKIPPLLIAKTTFDKKTIPNDNNDTFVTTKRNPSILPTQSQLDPEVLAALPAEVRAEILSEYQIPQQQQEFTDHIRPVTAGATASPTASVYVSVHSTPNTSPQSASICKSAPKTPSSSILHQSVRNTGRRSQGIDRRMAARMLEGSPSPSLSAMCEDGIQVPTSTLMLAAVAISWRRDDCSFCLP